MAQSKFIPLSVPHIFGQEWRKVKRCFDTGWVSSAGPFVDELENEICQLTSCQYAVALSSGTAALQVALEVVGVEAEDEVIVPTVTFIAPVNAVTYLGAYPVFMDCDDYFNIDSEKVMTFLNEQTYMRNGGTYNRKTKRRVRAIIPVHIFGNAVHLMSLVPFCRRRNISVVEDATESLGTVYNKGIYQGRHTGTIGDIGCYSFNGNKIITAGGGGMLVTNNVRYAEQAKYLTTQAKDDALYFIHNSIGYNFRLNSLQAAMGAAQLKELSKVIRIKKVNYQIYKDELDSIKGLMLRETPPFADNNHWMYALQVDEKKYGRSIDDLIRLFQGFNIEVRPLWYLNHRQKPYRGCQSYEIKKAQVMLKSTLNIPCSCGLTKNEIFTVINFLKKWKR